VLIQRKLRAISAALCQRDFRILREAALHEHDRERVDHGCVFVIGSGIFFQNRRRNGNLLLPSKARRPVSFVEQAAEAEDVAARVCFRTLEQFRRHELERAYNYACCVSAPGAR